MNIVNEHYSPRTFHVNTIQTVLVSVDGSLLRISRPERALLKHAFHTDRTLTEKTPRMVSQSIYDLTGAQVKLRPRRLARRRWFSRKYPICIRLSRHAKEITQEMPKMRKSSGKSTGTPSSTRARLPQDRLSNSSVSVSPESHELTWHSLASVDEMNEVDGYVSDSSTEGSSGTESDDSAMRHSVADFPRHGTAIGNTSKRAAKRQTRSIYLFARSTREKERWFHRLRKACNKYQWENTYFDPEARFPQRRLSFSSADSFKNLSNDYILYILHGMQFNR